MLMLLVAAVAAVLLVAGIPSRLSRRQFRKRNDTVFALRTQEPQRSAIPSGAGALAPA